MASSPWVSRVPRVPGEALGKPPQAPVWLPTKPRERVTTNRREAVTLARLRRAGALTPVDVPTVDEAAMRDLCRARDEALRARQTAQLRRPALRLRHALRSTGRAS